MTKAKRLQVPISAAVERMIRSAAKVYKISTAEWARRILSKAAARDTATSVVMDPLEAVRAIGALDLPVSDDPKKMTQEAIKGRLR